MSAPEYATSGYTAETNVNVSCVGTGQQQRANATYGETATSDPSGGQIGPDFALAFQTIWGNFITTDNPRIDSSIAIGAAAASNSSSTSSTSPASSWPPFTIYAPNQLFLNQTGGTAFQAPQSPTQNITGYGEPGLSNDIGLFNAYTGEGDRGYRCDFWRSVRNIVPE